MKRFSIAAMALIACMAVGMATVSATAGATGGDSGAQVAKKKKKKKKKKFPATVTLSVKFTAPGTYFEGSTNYSGSVSSRGPAACHSGRPVTISRNGSPVASTTTSGTGSYDVTQSGPPAAGQYAASTPKIVVKKKGKRNPKTGKRKKKKLICLGAATAPVALS